MDHDTLSDADLLARWCAGDREAGEVLTGRHFTALRGFVRRKIDNPAVIDEIVQDTFLSLVEGKHRIREGVKFRGFLNCIASRRVFRWFRERGRFESFEPDEVSVSRAASTLGLMRSDTKLLYLALRELPAEEQLALELYLSPGRTPKLDGGLPLGRLVRRWLFRGAIGKDTRRAAGKALDAAERLDVVALDARWRRR